jgi:putative ABC transport system substrate-binding protein
MIVSGIPHPGRRQCLRLLAGAAASSLFQPLAARAQRPPMPVVGFLSLAPSGALSDPLAALHRGLKEIGYVEGQNVAFEYRWANDRYDRLAPLAAELARRPVTVMIVSGGNVAVVAAKSVTSTVPIVFTGVADPVKSGFVASLNRPGGNLTGIALLSIELDAKRLELLHSLVPASGVIGALVNPKRPDADFQLREIEGAAQRVGRSLVVFRASTEPEIETVFTGFARQRVGALVVGADPFFTSRRGQILGLAARHAVPAIYQWRDFVLGGGLMSYGPSLADAYRQAGIYAGRIIKGERAADLPVVQPTKFELVINVKTARTLGLTVPSTLLARADEVIE